MSKCAIHIILAEFLNDYLGCALGQQPLSLFCPCVVGKNWVFSPANKIHSTRLISIECYLEAHGVQPSSCKALEILTENRAKKKQTGLPACVGAEGYWQWWLAQPYYCCAVSSPCGKVCVSATRASRTAAHNTSSHLYRALPSKQIQT